MAGPCCRTIRKNLPSRLFPNILACVAARAQPHTRKHFWSGKLTAVLWIYFVHLALPLCNYEAGTVAKAETLRVRAAVAIRCVSQILTPTVESFVRFATLPATAPMINQACALGHLVCCMTNSRIYVQSWRNAQGFHDGCEGIPGQNCPSKSSSINHDAALPALRHIRRIQ